MQAFVRRNRYAQLFIDEIYVPFDYNEKQGKGRIDGNTITIGENQPIKTVVSTSLRSRFLGLYEHGDSTSLSTLGMYGAVGTQAGRYDWNRRFQISLGNKSIYDIEVMQKSEDYGAGDVLSRYPSLKMVKQAYTTGGAYISGSSDITFLEARYDYGGVLLLRNPNQSEGLAFGADEGGGWTESYWGDTMNPYFLNTYITDDGDGCHTKWFANQGSVDTQMRDDWVVKIETHGTDNRGGLYLRDWVNDSLQVTRFDISGDCFVQYFSRPDGVVAISTLATETASEFFMNQPDGNTAVHLYTDPSNSHCGTIACKSGGNNITYSGRGTYGGQSVVYGLSPFYVAAGLDVGADGGGSTAGRVFVNYSGGPTAIAMQGNNISMYNVDQEQTILLSGTESGRYIYTYAQDKTDYGTLLGSSTSAKGGQLILRDIFNPNVNRIKIGFLDSYDDLSYGWGWQLRDLSTNNVAYDTRSANGSSYITSYYNTSTKSVKGARLYSEPTYGGSLALYPGDNSEEADIFVSHVSRLIANGTTGSQFIELIENDATSNTATIISNRFKAIAPGGGDYPEYPYYYSQSWQPGGKLPSDKSYPAIVLKNGNGAVPSDSINSYAALMAYDAYPSLKVFTSRTPDGWGSHLDQIGYFGHSDIMATLFDGRGAKTTPYSLGYDLTYGEANMVGVASQLTLTGNLLGEVFVNKYAAGANSGGSWLNMQYGSYNAIITTVSKDGCDSQYRNGPDTEGNKRSQVNITTGVESGKIVVRYNKISEANSGAYVVITAYSNYPEITLHDVEGGIIAKVGGSYISATDVTVGNIAVYGGDVGGKSAEMGIRRVGTTGTSYESFIRADKIIGTASAS